MKTIPILFNTGMVQALQEGRKTQTRRIIKADLSDCYFQSLVHHASGLFTFVPNGNEIPTEKDVIEVKCPYGKPGDILWVRERWAELKNGHNEVYIEYKANGDSGDWKWKPSIYMPKAACRLFLKVVSVRVERLQDISYYDAPKEGVEMWKNDGDEIYRDYNAKISQGFERGETYFTEALPSFTSLWQSINGAASWDQNPWVWVVEFERTEKPAGF